MLTLAHLKSCAKSMQMIYCGLQGALDATLLQLRHQRHPGAGQAAGLLGAIQDIPLSCKMKRRGV